MTSRPAASVTMQFLAGVMRQEIAHSETQRRGLRLHVHRLLFDAPLSLLR